MGREEEGREGKGRKEERNDLIDPQTKFLDLPLISVRSHSASIFDKCCHSKNAVNFVNALT
jgi:hypothetical protein